MKAPFCNAATPSGEIDGETCYECSEPLSPCYGELCDVEMCMPQNVTSKKGECIHKDGYDLCSNDDTYNYGNYCPGHCDFYESNSL